MGKEASGWKQQTAGTANYRRKFRHAFGPTANKESQAVHVDTNVGTGDFTVSATGSKKGGLEGFPVGSDIPIYKFNARGNEVTVLNEKYFKKMYEGNIRKNGTFKNLNSKTKIDTLTIAVKNANTQPEQQLLDELKGFKSYKSAKNVVDTEPQTITVGPPDGSGGGVKNSDGGGRSSGGSNGRGSSFFNFGPNSDFFDIGDFNTLGTYNDFSLAVVQPDRAGGGNPSKKGAGYYRYPEGRIPNLGYDYIQITSYAYVPVGLAKPVDAQGNVVDPTTPLPAGTIKDYKSSTRTEADIFKDPINIIQLPMTGGISDNSSVSWSQDTLNELNNIAAGIAYNRIMQAGGEGNPFTSVAGAAMDVMNVAGNLLKGAGGADIKKGISLYFAGQAASAPKALQRETGKMINNNMELLFNGPTLRTFQFSFKLRPRSETEAELCRAIIKAFKRDMAPRKDPGTRMFLETPRIFNIQYIYQAQGDGVGGSGSLLTMTEHPYMNKIKACALTSLNVNYTPDGSYMTYETNGSMVGYDLQMSFQEIEPVFNDDQDAEAENDNMGF